MADKVTKGSKTEVETVPISQLTELMAQLAAAQTAIAELKAERELSRSQRPGNSTLPQWQGHSAVSVVRYLALRGYKGANINRALASFGCFASPSTVTTQSYTCGDPSRKGALSGTDRQKLLDSFTASQRDELHLMAMGGKQTTTYVG